jgi:hypothetical protein
MKISLGNHSSALNRIFGLIRRIRDFSQKPQARACSINRPCTICGFVQNHENSQKPDPAAERSIKSAVPALQTELKATLKATLKEEKSVSALQRQALEFWETDEITEKGRALRKFIHDQADSGLCICPRCRGVFRKFQYTDSDQINFYRRIRAGAQSPWFIDRPFYFDTHEDKISSLGPVFVKRLSLLCSRAFRGSKVLILSSASAWDRHFKDLGCKVVSIRPWKEKEILKRIINKPDKLEPVVDIILIDRILEYEKVPSCFVSKAEKLLKTGGLFTVITPDFASRPAAVKMDKWHLFDNDQKSYFDWASLIRVITAGSSRLVTADMAWDTAQGLSFPGMMSCTLRKTDLSEKNSLNSWLTHKSFTVLSEGARGDNLLLMPLVRSLKALGAKEINCISPFPEFLKPLGLFDTLISSEDTGAVEEHQKLMASGKSPGISTRYQAYSPVHFARAYGALAGIYIDNIEFEFSFNSFNSINSFKFCDSLNPEKLLNTPEPLLNEITLPSKPYAVINTMCGSRLKRWSPKEYQNLADYFVGKNIPVVVIGGKSDCIPLKNALNLLDIKDVYSVLKRACVFIGLDSFHLHAASFFRMPKIIIFGSTLSKPVITDSSGTYAVTAGLFCTGCRQRCLPTQWPYNLWCSLMEGNPYDTPDSLEAVRIAQAPGTVLPPCMQEVKAEDIIRVWEKILLSKDN